MIKLKNVVLLLIKPAKNTTDKKLKAAFWYGFRNPFHRITDMELTKYLDNIKD
jgi:hypothetical protein